MLRSKPSGTRSVFGVAVDRFPDERAGVKVQLGAAPISPDAQPMHGRLLHVIEMHLRDLARRRTRSVISAQSSPAAVCRLGTLADRGLHVANRSEQPIQIVERMNQREHDAAAQVGRAL